MAYADKDDIDKKYRFFINSIDLKNLKKKESLKCEIGKIIVNEEIKDKDLRIRYGENGNVYFFTHPMIEELEKNKQNSELVQNSIEGKVFGNSSETYMIQLKD